MAGGSDGGISLCQLTRVEWPLVIACVDCVDGSPQNSLAGKRFAKADYVIKHLQSS
ncbi:hypothetical protein KIN20_000870 [Parelaphostrongylus tenuis]|uniref:Uncharacterized protein n=1 Tax=Parelaphostrongylus tenuis TaxID=148309 RepID=A0AAD5MDY9_PARTN|nr:hypothetical protein KIN20_000870 [Parelaphostrongylus tenuis]